MTPAPTPIAANAAGKPAHAATDPNGPTGRLATWLADTTLDDVPASVREHAKHLLLDGVACAAAAAARGTRAQAAVLVGIGAADRKSTRLNSSHLKLSRMPSSA